MYKDHILDSKGHFSYFCHRNSLETRFLLYKIKVAKGVISMEWLSYLLILICPLMMIFCMRGHGGGHSHQHDLNSKTMDTKFKLLEDENRKLKDEVENLSKIIKKGS